MRKACFVDRDGVINVETSYLSDPEHVEIIPGAPLAVKLLHEYGFMAIAVTNQAGVARGFYPESAIRPVHDRIQELLWEQGGVKLDAFFHCPHHPDFTGECACRKPAPGMLLAAAKQFDLDLANSFLVGDRLSDIGAAENAGCGAAYLVRTGYGEQVIAEEDTSGVKITDNLLSAVKDFLNLS